MAVTYVPIDGEEVSKEWGTLLHDIRVDDHVPFNVNEGHRTMARQSYFYNLYRSGRGNLAAVPSTNAPHIRTGRFDHAIDFRNAEGVRQAAARRGVRLTRTVRGEEWHLEADAKQLANYYKKHSGPGDPVIRPYYSKRFRGNSKPSVVRLQTLLRGAGLKGVPLNGKYDRDTRAAVGRFQHRHGMKVDRTVGAATWKALRKAQG